MVINHTSDQHPWFQRARRAKPGSNLRNYYVWSDTDHKYEGTRIIFCDTEISNWAWDPLAKAYYWHRFFSHQPDLNFDNPRVFVEVTRVMKFWLDIGVDGLRLDAVPYLAEREGTNNENLPETHAVLKRLRQWLDDHYEDRMFLAEANQWPEDVLPYFGDGDECHMAFHFPLMPRMYMALAREDRYPITDIMRQTPDIPDNCQWAMFLRNHDELTLEMVTDRERDYLWQFYAAEPRARINLGIRRRLATAAGGRPAQDRAAQQPADVRCRERRSSTTATRSAWATTSSSATATACARRCSGRPTAMPGSPGPIRSGSTCRRSWIRATATRRSTSRRSCAMPSSLLNWMRRLIAARKSHSAFGRGALTFLYPRNRKILAYLRSRQPGDDPVRRQHERRRRSRPSSTCPRYKSRVPVELLGRSAFPPIGDLPYFITLPGYGFYWFLLAEEAEAPKWHEPNVLPLPEFRTLVLGRGWTSIIDGGNAVLLWQTIVPEFLANQRWFAGKGSRITAVSLADAVEFPSDGGEFLITCIETKAESGGQPSATCCRSPSPGRARPTIRGASCSPSTLARARIGATDRRPARRHGDGAVRPGDRAAASATTSKLPTRGGGRLVFRQTPALTEACRRRMRRRSSGWGASRATPRC